MNTYEAERLQLIRANKDKPRLDYLSDRGRLIHGPTPPGGSKPSPGKLAPQAWMLEKLKIFQAHLQGAYSLDLL